MLRGRFHRAPHTEGRLRRPRPFGRFSSRSHSAFPVVADDLAILSATRFARGVVFAHVADLTSRLRSRAKPPAINGQKSRTSASVVIVPTRPFDQNTRMSPAEPIIDRRKESSARLPSTMASVNGAGGMPIFLNA